MEDIETLEPYGQGNPRPLFYGESLEVVSSRIVGEHHLKLALRERGLIDSAAPIPGESTTG